MTFAVDVKSLLNWWCKEPPNDVLNHEWMEVEALWEDRKALAPPPDAIRAATLDSLFYDAHGARRPAVCWLQVNMAERALARELTASQLCAQYTTLLSIGGRRGLPVTTYPTSVEFLTKSENDKRETYVALLYTLQSMFMEGRYVRRLRSEVSVTIFRYGVGVSLVALVVLLLWLRQTLLKVEQAAYQAGLVQLNETVFALVAVAMSGALGAFFSRAMRFQADIPKLEFETLIQIYIGKMLRLRILYGMIGAIVLYMVIQGGLIKGDLFPKLSADMISEKKVWQLGAGFPRVTHLGSHAKVTITTTLGLAEQLAKLLFWSFLAGFSERLVPDALLQLEKRSGDAAGKVR